ncbi:MAG: 4Fe-4S binding protein [Armatimonadota bacterium]
MASRGPRHDAGRAPGAWRWIAVGILFAVVIGGLLYPPLGPVAAVTMGALLTMSAFHARCWCGKLCPRGSSLDLIVRWISPGRRFPALLRRPGCGSSFLRW